MTRNSSLLIVLGVFSLALAPHVGAAEERIAISPESMAFLGRAPADTSTGGRSTNQKSSPITEKLWANYFNILYGPSITEPTQYQPTPQGEPDPNRPVMLENFLTLGYDIDDRWTLSGTMYFMYIPVDGHEILLKDPYLKLSHNSLVSSGSFNLYGDVRMHFPITWASRDQDLLAGVQALVHPTISPENSNFTYGLWAWARYNVFGGQGWGDDFELYFGPHLNYQISSKLAFTVLLETGASHAYGDDPFDLRRGQPDIEPGLSWDITPSLNFSPFLNIYLGEAFSLKNTGMGATLSWMLF